MEFFGVKFAPLRVPLKRRLQTLAAAAWICVFAFGGFVSWIITIYLLFFTQWIRYFVLIYVGWIYCFDRDTCDRGGRRNWWTFWMRNCAWWKYFCDYFPIKLVKTVDLDPSRNYLFCSFPHGVLATGAFAVFGTDALKVKEVFPGLEPKMLTLRQHFMVPFFREIPYGFESCGASAKSIEYLLKDKKYPGELSKAVVLVVGGAAESLKCKPATYRIILNQRKGFVKIALKTGTPLVPVFSFGETDIYDQIRSSEESLFSKAQEYFRRITGISPILVIGRGFFQYTFGIVPQRKPITVVVGEPLEVTKIHEPTRDQIDKYHEEFKEKLIDLFETNKHKYLKNPDEIKLIIE